MPELDQHASEEEKCSICELHLYDVFTTLQYRCCTWQCLVAVTIACAKVCIRLWCEGSRRETNVAGYITGYNMEALEICWFYTTINWSRHWQEGILLTKKKKERKWIPASRIVSGVAHQPIGVCCSWIARSASSQSCIDATLREFTETISSPYFTLPINGEPYDGNNRHHLHHKPSKRSAAPLVDLQSTPLQCDYTTETLR